MTELPNHPVTLLKNVESRLKQAQSHVPELLADEILQQLAEIIQLFSQHTDAAYEQGQQWLVQIFTHLPQFTPTIERKLLWLFGGECLHFLTDEEIAEFQRQDDEDFAGE